MRYDYGTDSYNKRGITNNVLIHVISTDYKNVVSDRENYREHAAVLKTAEEVSQEDSCPIAGREQLKPILSALREHQPNLSARQTQTGNAIFTKEETDISPEEAQFLIANGTLAVISSAYKTQARETLFAHGILPLLTEDELHLGDYLFLEDIKNALEEGKKELTAFYVKEHLEQTVFGIEFGNKQQLDRIFAE